MENSRRTTGANFRLASTRKESVLKEGAIRIDAPKFCTSAPSSAYNARCLHINSSNISNDSASQTVINRDEHNVAKSKTYRIAHELSCGHSSATFAVHGQSELVVVPLSNSRGQRQSEVRASGRYELIAPYSLFYERDTHLGDIL